jgi:hypothetical protein
MYYSATWKALMYNYSTGRWETLWQEANPVNTGQAGWCWWEAKGFDSSNWPSLGSSFEAKEIIIKLPTDPNWHYADSTYAHEHNDMKGALYVRLWVNRFWHWWLSG